MLTSIALLTCLVLPSACLVFLHTAALFVDKTGRRPLLLVGECGQLHSCLCWAAKLLRSAKAEAGRAYRKQP